VWAAQRWDRILDLGLGGANTYTRWTDRFRCPITPLRELRRGFEDFRRVRGLVGAGCGRVIDEHGLDWWEIMSILLNEHVDTLILMERFAATLAANDEVFISRSGPVASLLQCLLGSRVTVFHSRRVWGEHVLGHYMRVFNKLSISQMADIFFDKYDSGYHLRGRVARKPRPSSFPVVLVPTAYVNVSRTGTAYANTFPDENFLLVATRRSGWIKDLPRNMTSAWLSSYAGGLKRNREHAQLTKRWRSLVDELASRDEFDILHRLGHLDDLLHRFLHALNVRDAWQNVLDAEPVQAVLCSDDSNPYTRIPLLLAQGRGLPNIACHHGALDGRYVFKREYGEVIWVKGVMEQDYLVRKCEVPRKRTEVAAPALPTHSSVSGKSRPQQPRPHILFFSEAYEVLGGRPEEFYRDILPPLADLAISTGRKLIVKLHPAESKRERVNALNRILSGKQQAVTQLVTGPLTEELLSGAWFGITILSTVVVECAIRGIPCFLCKWLEFWPYGYVEQFMRYGVGIGIDNPSEIHKIPQYIEQHSDGANQEEVLRNCWQPAVAGRLREFMTSSLKPVATVAS
jgi:hypothetical protein